MKWSKVKAGSLQFAIMISAIIAVLLSAFMVLVHSHSFFIKKSDILIETVQQTEQVIVGNLDDFSVKRDTTYTVLNEEKSSRFKKHESFWGVFGKVYAETQITSKSFEKIALVSGWQQKQQRTALYVKETNRPVIVVGDTKIEGKTYLPKQGIRSGTIVGNSYHGSQLVYGTILKSDETLPKLSPKLTQHITALQKMPLPDDDEHYIDLRPRETYSNSFFAPVKTVFSDQEIDIHDVQLIGNILIRSNTKIKVAASSRLKDVILIAPEIEIEDHTKGTFQAIASEQIILGENCELMYPSALVLRAEDDPVEPNNLTKKKHIFIDKNTSIKGMVCFLQNVSKVRFEPQLLLKENTTVEGFVYCEQQLELLGNVYGSIYTNGFITKQFGSIYQNHIYNGVVSNKELIDEYVGFPLENLDQKVMKWLY